MGKLNSNNKTISSNAAMFSLLLQRKREFSHIVRENSSKEEIADKINQLNAETLKKAIATVDNKSNVITIDAVGKSFKMSGVGRKKNSEVLASKEIYWKREATVRRPLPVRCQIGSKVVNQKLQAVLVAKRVRIGKNSVIIVEEKQIDFTEYYSIKKIKEPHLVKK